MAWDMQMPKIDTPSVPYAPNRPPGVRMPNSKRLTEALMPMTKV